MDNTSTKRICCNCGSSEHIVDHYVVPLEFGGNDIHRNIVPLCYECHRKVREYYGLDPERS